MAVFEGLAKNLKKHLRKRAFLLVRFLWAYKENERNNNRKTHGFKTSTVK